MDTQLQIVVSAVNDAAGPLAEVASSFNTIEEAAISAAEATLSQWDGVAQSIEGATSGLSENFDSTMEIMNSSAAAAADAAASDWQASVSALQSSLASAASQADEDFASMAEGAAASGEEMESSISSVGGKIQMVGIQLGIMGAAFVAPAAGAVKAAGDQVDAFDQLNNTITNLYANAGKPQAGLSTEIADLTAQIDQQRASIGTADAALQKWVGTTQGVAAAHAAAGASITVAQLKIEDLQQKLAQLTNGASLAGGSAAATAEQFENAARASTSFGFNVADSATALTYLFSTTQNVTETMAAYQDAMDLSAKLNIPLATAANDVVQAMNGQGRALRDLGVNVADGLAGQTALDAIQEKVAGSAQLAATQGLGPLAIAQAKFNETLADFGTTALPLLTSLLQVLTKIIVAVDQWAQAHPRLAEALLVFLTILGSILIVVGAILVPLGLIIISIEALTTAVAVLDGGLVAGLVAFGIYAAAFVAFIAVVTLVIVYHKQIMAAIEAAWNWIIDKVSNAMLAVYNGLVSAGNTLSQWWTGLWNGIYNALETVWNKITAIVNSILAAVSKVSGAVSGVVGAVGGTIGNVVGGAIHAFASGGIVNGPTLALVGEAGPEAIIPLSAFNGGSSLAGAGFGGSGGGIVININGGYYLDQNAAQQIGNALATSIGRQLKL